MRNVRAFLLGLGVTLAATTASAQPSRVVYQGFLTDSGGDPVTDTVDLFFSLYPAPTGGADVWNELVSDVDIVDGSFAVELTMSEADLTQDDLWIAMAVGTASEELPRMRVGSVPFALRGRDADRLAAVSAAGYQLLVAGSCGPDQAISAIHPDGLVDCLPDDAIGVTSVAGGAGLVDLGTMGNVTLDVAPGDGIQVGGDVVSVAFGGNGFVDVVARSDHDHAGQFVPVGATMSCFGGDKVTAIDPTNGNVSCGPDADTTYTATGGVAIGPDPLGTFDFVMDTTPDVVVGASVYADDYYVSPAARGWISVHPSDFKPADSAVADYYAPYFGPGALQAAGSFELYAQLPLPQGSTITTLTMYYENADPGLDGISCDIIGLDLLSGSAGTWGGTFGATMGGIQFSQSFPFLGVNNDASAYTARCTISDFGAVTGDVKLWGYVLEYTYTVMGR